MTPSLNSLKGVVVKRKDQFTRKQKLQIFRDCFLGQTHNSKLLKIQNEDDIYFRYDKVNFVLKAFSDKPLLISNPSLGYKIDYELTNFEATFSKLSVTKEDLVESYYSGLSRFEEIDNSNEILALRKKAYEGSQVHFFLNLANNIWDKEQFLIIHNKNVLDPKNCFKIEREKDFVKVEVLAKEYKKENINEVASYDLIFNKNEHSGIIFETDVFYVYPDGNNSKIENIVFSGKLSEEKVGDMLPLNYVYVPENEIYNTGILK
ncbi:hypothetical protein [Flavobacterium sp. WC2429]|uniref:DUF4292 domain-containing protein n=2 Tax=unclassified Flavobacterium TaxID=196869 RepID=A0AB39W722_9FLAO